jgi:DNA-directed RNA polymerase sigma subunit (sigma70/sigma32)
MSDIDTDDCDSNCFFQEQTSSKPKGEKDVVFDNLSFRGVKSAGTINPEVKQAKRDVAKDAVEAFLAKGGKITKCPPGRRPNFRFGAPRAPAGSVGTSSSNDLARKLWRDPIPPPDEERHLIRQAQRGNDRAKEKLFKAHHRTIRKIAGEYSGRAHNEIMEAGIEGFCYAVYKFDLRWNTGLNAYARDCIRNKIRDAIKEWHKGGIKSDTRTDLQILAPPPSRLSTQSAAS